MRNLQSSMVITAATLHHPHGARSLVCALLLASAGAVSSSAFGAEPEPELNPPDFEILFAGNARIRSFTYMHPGPDNWIDSIIGVESRMLRYKSTYLLFQYDNETDMGHGTSALGVFDPNRGRWYLALGSRTEFTNHFFEVLLRHDCYHGIDRFLPGQDYKGTSEGIGFGTLRYLPKYRFKAHDNASALSFPLKFDYYANPLVYAPNGEPWQRHPYRARLEANLRLNVFSWRRLGVDLESLNVFYYAKTKEVQRYHVLQLDAVLHGNSAAMMAFFAWWPYDDQVFRNRDGKVVFGFELNI